MASLKQVLPQLRSLFRKRAASKGVFPLFPPQTESSIWKSYPLKAGRQAAILVPLVSCEGLPSLIFTTRSSDMPTHASEVSFPGGHFDESLDNSLEGTAIREAQEELLGDYPWEEVEIIGKASPVPSITGMPVTPIIAVLPQEIDRNTFPGSPNEVEDVFCVSLEELLEVESSQRSERFRANVPVFPALNGKRIWGLTAIVTRMQAKPLLEQNDRVVFVNLNTTLQRTLMKCEGKSSDKFDERIPWWDIAGWIQNLHPQRSLDSSCSQ